MILKPVTGSACYRLLLFFLRGLRLFGAQVNGAAALMLHINNGRLIAAYFITPDVDAQ